MKQRLEYTRCVYILNLLDCFPLAVFLCVPDLITFGSGGIDDFLQFSTSYPTSSILCNSLTTGLGPWIAGIDIILRHSCALLVRVAIERRSCQVWETIKQEPVKTPVAN